MHVACGDSVYIMLRAKIAQFAQWWIPLVHCIDLCLMYVLWQYFDHSCSIFMSILFDSILISTGCYNSLHTWFLCIVFCVTIHCSKWQGCTRTCLTHEKISDVWTSQLPRSTWVPNLGSPMLHPGSAPSLPCRLKHLCRAYLPSMIPDPTCSAEIGTKKAGFSQGFNTISEGWLSGQWIIF